MLSSIFLVFSALMLSDVLGMKHILYDVPVSNHGARVRLLIKSKGIEDKIEIASPASIGGLKSPEYLKLNCQGKMPLLLCDEKFSIAESDPISRYVIDRFPQPPSFIPKSAFQRSLSDQICRFHDVYVSPIQGSMYKAPGTQFSVFGTNRPAALQELKRQLGAIEKLVVDFEETFPDMKGPFLCGEEISLADASLFPTAVFCEFMLPQFFGWTRADYLGPRLQQWVDYLSSSVPPAAEVRAEIETALEGWKANGRWDPIVAEMSS